MRSRGTIVAAVLALVVACAQDPGPESPTRVEVPVPELENREAEVQQQLREQRAELDRQLADPQTTAEELAAAYGETGRYYHAYALSDAALACYANARALDDSDPRWFYYAALLLTEKGQLEEAAKLLEAVISRRPDTLPALLRLGELRMNQNRPDEAHEVYERALAIDPRTAAALYGLARIATTRRDYESAVDFYERALELAPDASLIHYPLSQAYRKLGRDDEADAHLALRGLSSVGFADPWLADLGSLTESTGAYLRTGSTAFLEERFEDAEREYRIAVETDPRDPEARKSLASALARLGRNDEAIEQYLVACDLEPDNPLVLYNLAWLRARQGDPDRALEGYREVVALDPEFKEAQLNLGLLLEERGELAEALVHLEQVLRVDPQDAVATLARPRVMTALGRHDEALRDLRRAVSDMPENATARVALGTALSVSGQPDEAIAELRRALDGELAPAQRAVAHFNLGVAEAARGRDDEASRQYALALETDPEMLDARFHMASAIAREGRYGEAAEQYGLLLTQAPEHLPGRLAHATALLLAGSCAAARRSLEEGREALPDQPLLTHTLARILAACPDDGSRDGARALELAQAAHRSLGSIESAETVAMAYAEAGRFKDAVDWQRRLIAEAESRNETATLARLRSVLELYESNQPFRLPAGS